MKASSISNSEHYIWGSACDGWHLLKREDVSIIQERVPAGESEMKHFHNLSRQFFYVLEGTATMHIGDDIISLHPGEGLEVPPQIPHQFRNDSDSDVSFLVISVPKSHGDRVDVAAVS
ncbi:MAG: cupin domain-containing protein [Chloroflexota bacterium]